MKPISRKARKPGKPGRAAATGVVLLLLLLVPLVWRFVAPRSIPVTGRAAGSPDPREIPHRETEDGEALRRKRSLLLDQLKRDLRAGERKRVIASGHAEFPVAISERARQAYNLPDEQATAINVVDSIAIRAPSPEELAEVEDKIRAAFDSIAFVDEVDRAALEEEVRDHFTRFPKAYRILTATCLAMARNPDNRLISAADTDQVLEEPAETGSKLQPVESWDVAESHLPQKTLRSRHAYLFGSLED